MPLALWYLVFDGRKWFDPAYLEHMSAGERVATWITRALYAVPKLGVIIGFVSLFKFQQYSARIYLACWLFAMGHTAMYYRGSRLPDGEIEWMRLAVHHIIPHLFFAGMLLSLYWFRRRIR